MAKLEDRRDADALVIYIPDSSRIMIQAFMPESSGAGQALLVVWMTFLKAYGTTYIKKGCLFFDAPGSANPALHTARLLSEHAGASPIICKAHIQRAPD